MLILFYFMAVRHGHVWAKVQAFHMRSQHRILSINFKWNDFIPYVKVAATSDLDSIINIVRVHWLGLFGHAARFSRDVPASNILSICCASGNGYPPGTSWRRSSRRPRTTCLDHISSDTGFDQYIFSGTKTFAVEGVATATKATRTWLTESKCK